MNWWVVALLVGWAFLLDFRLTNIARIGVDLQKQMENTRYFLGEIEKRMKRVNDKLHGIEAHTRRAVKDDYERDDWNDRQPPV